MLVSRKAKKLLSIGFPAEPPLNHQILNATSIVGLQATSSILFEVKPFGVRLGPEEAGLDPSAVCASAMR